MKLHPDEVPLDSLRVKKAGVIIHGYLNHDPITNQPHTPPVHYIVAPWSQGRCVDNDEKFYFLSKGSVDDGEEIERAAIRETFEEAGIDVNTLPDSQVIQTSIVDRVIESPHGKNHRIWMKLLDIIGIETLVGQLKNQEAQTQNGASLKERFPSTLSKGVSVQVLTNNFPDFVCLKESLRNIICNDTFMGEHIKQSVLESLQASKGSAELANMRERMKKPVKKAFDQAVETLKKQLKSENLLGDDAAYIKLDGRIRPLAFYQEGADLLTVREYLTRIVKQAKKYPEYDRNMLGIWEAKIMHGPSSPSLRLGFNHQLAALMPIVTLEDIKSADITTTEKFILTAMHARCQREQQASALSR